jgi:hypothetical protein
MYLHPPASWTTAALAYLKILAEGTAPLAPG